MTISMQCNAMQGIHFNKQNVTQVLSAMKLNQNAVSMANLKHTLDPHGQNCIDFVFVKNIGFKLNYQPVFLP